MLSENGTLSKRFYDVNLGRKLIILFYFIIVFLKADVCFTIPLVRNIGGTCQVIWLSHIVRISGDFSGRGHGSISSPLHQTHTHTHRGGQFKMTPLVPQGLERSLWIGIGVRYLLLKVVTIGYLTLVNHSKKLPHFLPSHWSPPCSLLLLALLFQFISSTF